MIYFTLWTEKIEGKGEDAPPTLLLGDDHTGVLGVYDGLGGSGSKVYWIENEDNESREYSGAYLAARLAKAITEDFYWQADLIENFHQLLKNELANDFQDYFQSIDNQPSKLKSKLIRALPTTLALLFFEENPLDKFVNVWACWAGDSRCYILQKDGLRQISMDDLTGQPDAWENLQLDATISNCLNAGEDFTLHQKAFSFSEPSILITATDGCFGYLPSPMHFEYLLLETLSQASVDTNNWQNSLQTKISAISGDDASLSLWAWGFEDLNEWNNYLQERKKIVYQTYICFFENADNQPINTMRDLWEEYKLNYYLDDLTD
jgi:serine/threonine protein phosphatase PrpC